MKGDKEAFVTSRILLFFSIGFFLFWFMVALIGDPYRYVIAGVIFELLALPVLLGMLAVAVAALVRLPKEKFRSFSFFSLIFLFLTVLIILLKK